MSLYESMMGILEPIINKIKSEINVYTLDTAGNMNNDGTISTRINGNVRMLNEGGVNNGEKILVIRTSNGAKYGVTFGVPLKAIPPKRQVEIRYASNIPDLILSWGVLYFYDNNLYFFGGFPVYSLGDDIDAFPASNKLYKFSKVINKTPNIRYYVSELLLESPVRSIGSSAFIRQNYTYVMCEDLRIWRLDGSGGVPASSAMPDYTPPELGKTIPKWSKPYGMTRWHKASAVYLPELDTVFFYGGGAGGYVNIAPDDNMRTIISYNFKTDTWSIVGSDGVLPMYREYEIYAATQVPGTSNVKLRQGSEDGLDAREYIFDGGAIPSECVINYQDISRSIACSISYGDYVFDIPRYLAAEDPLSPYHINTNKVSMYHKDYGFGYGVVTRSALPTNLSSKGIYGHRALNQNKLCFDGTRQITLDGSTYYEYPVLDLNKISFKQN